MNRPVVCLIGPTAAGKSEVAVYLARNIGAEIISCDSMQVYRGADIASGKPTKRQLRRLTHHLIGVINPSQEYNAARFCSACLKLIREIHKRGKVPLIVGGSGLYLWALLEGLFKGPGQDARLRRRLYQAAEKGQAASLYLRLRDVDPKAASKIHPNDLRRIVRALEVYETTGRTISQWQQRSCGIRGKYALRIFGLRLARLRLYARIEQRVERMFRRGLVAEVKKLNALRLSRTAKSLLGYKEVVGFLEGKYSCHQARRLLKTNTRRYAKRQMTWFKKEKGVEWIDVGDTDSAQDVAEGIVNRICGKRVETKKKSLFC